MVFMALIFILISVPLSKRSQRSSRSYHTLLALVIYLIFNNARSVLATSIEKEILTIGMAYGIAIGFPIFIIMTLWFKEQFFIMINRYSIGPSAQ